LDANTQHLLNRGTQLTELLKQKQFIPIPVEEQVIVIFAGVKGYLDRVLTKEISKFEKLFIEHIKGKAKHILDNIRTTGILNKENEKELHSILEEFIPTCGIDLKEK
jgi:F0F1-type ATP synthase alpha subunit